MIRMTYDCGDDVFYIVITKGTSFVLMMLANFDLKVIKNQGVLHLFLMEFWMIRMTYDNGDDVYLMVIT